MPQHKQTQQLGSEVVRGVSRFQGGVRKVCVLNGSYNNSLSRMKSYPGVMTVKPLQHV